MTNSKPKKLTQEGSNARSRDVSLGDVVGALCEQPESLVMGRRQHVSRHEFPSRKRVVEIMEDLRSVLFPGYFGPSELTGETLRYHIGSTLDRVLHGLAEQIKRGLCAVCEELKGGTCEECDPDAFEIARNFVQRLPQLRRLLATDVQAAYEGDPALVNPDEAVFCYPGIYAVTSQRIAHELHQLGVPLLPRMITELAHSITGIDIHPGARIGEKFFIDHGTGVVIGETCIIGNNVRLYQGVTLGAKSFPLDDQGHPVKGVDRHPIVEDDVIVYSNATILGRITIGRGSSIGGNVWLTRSVPPGSVITQAQSRPGAGASKPAA